MSKKNRQRRAPANRRRRSSRNSASLAIPIVVGLVVLVIIAGAIISIKGRRPATAAAPGSGLVPNATVQPLSTGSIPYPNVRRIPLEEVRSTLETDQAILVDVRSRQSYDKSHAAGAISIPESEIDSHLDELPRDRDLVLY